MKALISKPVFWLVGSLLLAAAVLAVVMLASPEPVSSVIPSQAAQTQAQTGEMNPVVSAGTFPREVKDLPRPGPLPPSLAGAEPDIRLHTDAEGNLVVTPGVKDLFEFYLAGIDEEPLETVLARIQYALAAQLEGPALAQARDLLRRYVDYRAQLMDLEDQTGPSMVDGQLSLAVLRQRFQAQQGLRQSLFSETEDQAFFKLDAVQDQYMLERLAVQQDTTLNDAQRQQAMERLKAQLPPEVREMRERVTRHGELYARTKAMQASGASDEAIYQVRAETLGSEAAERLAQLDQKQSEWHQRLQDYAHERDRIRASGLSPADQQAAIDHLIESRFDHREQMRVRALDADL
ncbi:lipase secretion chaperone [Marinobacteraceae bacterium S3BR75-40.1]